MTLNLTEKEMEILTQLANDKGLTKTGLMRQALRLYQMIDRVAHEDRDKVMRILLPDLGPTLLIEPTNEAAGSE